MITEITNNVCDICDFILCGEFPLGISNISMILCLSVICLLLKFQTSDLIMDNMENNILLDITTEISGNLPIHDYTKSSTDTELPYETNDSVLLTDRSTFENTLVCDHPSILDSRNSFFDTLQNNRESVSTNDSENISKQSSKKVLGKMLNEFVVPSNEFSSIFENDIINVRLSEDEEKKMNEYPGNCGSRNPKANNKKPVRRPFQMKSANNNALNSTTISQETSDQNVTLNKFKRTLMELGISNCSSSSKKIVYSSYSESNAILIKSEQNAIEDLYRHDFEPPISSIDNMSCSTSIPINSVNIKSDPSSSLQDMVNKIPVTSYDELQKCYETNDSNKTTFDDEMDETLCHSSGIVVTEENNQKEIIVNEVELIVGEVEPTVNEVEPTVNEIEPTVNEKAPSYNLRNSTSRKRSLSIVSKIFKRKRSPIIKINRSIKMNPKKLKVINIIDPELYTYVGKDIRKPDFPLLDYWCNPRLYNYLAEIMKIKHGIKTNRKVADLVKKMYVEVKEAMNKNSNFSNNVENVKKMLWENNIILTTCDFHEFVRNYTPVCFQIRVIPSFSAPFDEVKLDVASYFLPLTKESFK